MRPWSSPQIPAISLSSPGVRAHDSATDRVVDVGHGDRASLYVCGITPYDSTHLGHANTYVTFDLLVRAWRAAGVEVTYTQNVTDIDDPLLERALATGVDWADLAADQVELFRSDMEALRVIAPSHFVGAVESIPDVVRAVERMLADGTAYRVGPDASGEGDGDVYADLSKDSRYGTVHLEPAASDEASRIAMFAEKGGDPQRVGKRAPLDPLLWRTAREGEPSWDGDHLGRGRPGWHIECATIAAMTLGAPLSVQGGGADLRFPHHEMSESHLRVISNTPKAVAVSVHSGLVGFEGHKMSKSRGNLVLVSALRAKGVDPMAIRLVILAHHYTSTWEYTERDLAVALDRLATWRAALALPSAPSSDEVVAGIRAALAENLDAPAALALIDAWAEQAVAEQAETVSESSDELRSVIDALLGVQL